MYSLHEKKPFVRERFFFFVYSSLPSSVYVYAVRGQAEVMLDERVHPVFGFQRNLSSIFFRRDGERSGDGQAAAEHCCYSFGMMEYFYALGTPPIASTLAERMLGSFETLKPYAKRVLSKISVK